MVGTDKGSCFFQTIIVDQNVKTARASLNQVRSAASALILRCAAGADSRGGIASNIGKLLYPQNANQEDPGYCIH